jgi:hypothetical protein
MEVSGSEIYNFCYIHLYYASRAYRAPYAENIIVPNVLNSIVSYPENYFLGLRNWLGLGDKLGLANWLGLEDGLGLEHGLELADGVRMEWLGLEDGLGIFFVA